MGERWIVKRRHYEGGESIINSDLLEHQARALAGKMNLDYQSSCYFAEPWDEARAGLGFEEPLRTAAEIAFDAVYVSLQSALAILTPEQREKFRQVYPTVSVSNVNAAFDLVKRTLDKNRREREKSNG